LFSKSNIANFTPATLKLRSQRLCYKILGFLT